MKRILITGKNSYIGTSFINYCQKNNVGFEIDAISVRGESWKDIDFSKYDAVLHVAGIAHRKETKENENLYYEINRDLSYEIAQKVKKNGVNQFVFLSSMSVYGLNSGTIYEATIPKPKSAYGKSKLQGEHLISSLQNDDFLVSIIRPPMVYGEGCKGNYPLLSNIAQKTPIFPKYDNERSMIYIYNLCRFVELIINYSDTGIFFPQNTQYVNSSDLVKKISELHNREIKLLRVFNPLITLGLNNWVIFKKIFGNLVYSKELSEYKINYNYYSYNESIKATEMRS